MKKEYTKKDMILFAEWIDSNDLALIGWDTWKSTTSASDIECGRTSQLVDIWEQERRNGNAQPEPLHDFPHNG